MLVPLSLGELCMTMSHSSLLSTSPMVFHTYCQPRREDTAWRGSVASISLLPYRLGSFSVLRSLKGHYSALWLKPHSTEKKGFYGIQKGKIRTWAPKIRNHRNYCDAFTKVWTVRIPGKRGGDSWFQKWAIWHCSNFSTDKHFTGVCDIHLRQNSTQAKLMEENDLKS